MKKNIVILYSKDTYDQVALALKEEYKNMKEDVNCILVEEEKYANFFSSQISKFLYKFTMRNMPWMNGLLGYVTNSYFTKFGKPNTEKITEKKEEKDDGFVGNIKTSLRKVDNIIERFDPDIVVCTTTKALGKAIYAKYRTNSHATICAAMTDYCTNRTFSNPLCDAYLVQNNGIKQTLITLGIAEEKIKVLKTPVLASKCEVYDKLATLEELGIVNKEIPNVVLAGGRCGSGKIKAAFKDIAPYVEKMNIIVLTNGSENIKTFISTYCKSAKIENNVYCVDAINDISKIYSICDVLLTTPTASITYEAMSRKIPCVLIKFSNYIEEGNFSYLTANGFAMRGEKTTHLVPALLSCLNKDSEYEELMANIEGEFTQKAAKDYAEYILSIAAEKPVVVEEIKDEAIESEQKQETKEKKDKNKKVKIKKGK